MTARVHAVGRCAAFAAVVFFSITSTLQMAVAESPFRIEDPSTIDAGQWESYTSYERSVSKLAATNQFPQIELHGGLRNNLLLHVNIPYVQTVQGDAARATGFGDVGVGLKYRFVHGQGEGLSAAVFPQMTIPVGNAATGLGSGKPTYELPLWVQGTASGFTICVGAGLSLNPAPGGRTGRFGGILVHREIGSRWMLGGEVIAKGPESNDDSATTTVNFGGSYRATPKLAILVRVGRTVAGPRTDNIYVGIYRAWGPPSADKTEGK